MGADVQEPSGDNQPKQPDKEIEDIPKNIIHQLSEHALGGFVLFYFHPVTGYPSQVLSFDSPSHCLAMQKHMSDWNQAISQLNVEGAKLSIRRALASEPEADENEEE